jgi:SAM-dependent methyltransferase
VVRSDNEAKYRTWNPVVRWLVNRFLERVAWLVADRRPERVLEVGCGEGMVMRYLHERCPGMRLDGLEADPGALAAARARNPGSLVLQGDACALGIRSRAYDLVLCLEVLEHLPEPGRALAEIRRVARRGCILSVPHEPFFRVGSLLRGKNVARLGDPPDHLQHWGRRQFEAFCAEHLRIERTVRAFPWLVVAASV